ncbi:hypothetical protein E8E13_005952 [Curvularia kusanoi]|uniref:Uncharacterized protein n=1 Tax=Curvularia kusanoi TaxID=90978 RepID=A0A9P4TAL9_CURKU|nr:hypothetical protein E8E13_005952 [Curvularia kusanoi]
MIEPLLHRIWTDHLGNVIRLRSNTELALDVHSETANTGDSLTNIETTVDSVFKDIDKLCQSGVSIEPAKSFTDPQIALLRKITTTTSLLWKGVRQESAVKSKLWSRLQDQPDAAKRLRSITSALKFLCRLHLATDTFVRAAEELPEFRSIEVILLDAYREQRSPGTKPQTALEVVRALGIKNKHRSWDSFFAEKKTEDKFQDMLKNKRFLHAELQLVDHYHT